ncbi:uncharacterized protein GGS22DRAFT_155057 [Annulohypoxylon maeteangense]|uniref:uncharacterized protein n=1 Tax=Annulohypoxylon maeteangense TaxID=1927788 RepID=UPI002007A4A4|nr:uncharacterized protein GGS22DRAFT_155057 [Annulohypoxylon maeteangense]KAI0888086.1 hypothetical protein GGS22DRAFT_155057 [Annulohypoxylon maeteangense]
MASRIASSALKRIVSNVEVERKFNLGPKFTSLFANPTGYQEKVPFVLRSHPQQLIRDTYYDTADGHLSELGMWVRKRSVDLLPLNPTERITGAKDGAQWNAKLRLAGHYMNSQFVEFDGRMDVSREVLRITENKKKLEDLQVVSDLQTRRSEWEVTQLADKIAPAAKMTIVVDAVTEAEAEVDKERINKQTFNHIIGEVELFQELITEGEDDAEHEAHRKEIGAQRMKELEEFMLSHPEFFSTSPSPIGKLSAYDTWKAEHA